MSVYYYKAVNQTEVNQYWVKLGKYIRVHLYSTSQTYLIVFVYVCTHVC